VEERSAGAIDLTDNEPVTFTDRIERPIHLF
jgi:hypothetical protein